ncbi:MAG TPA: ABC transporter ATP-binding protein [Thermoanaerobaculia bacterium]|nr:ABC transporter ATP-binding protein [Thermoanaerobaculia bacterium]
MSGDGTTAGGGVPAIRVDGVSKLYRRLAPGAQWKTLKSALLDGTLTRGLDPSQAIAALREVDFTVGRGEAFGVIGGNGSGKSTLLKLVAGILQPTAGEVVVDGRVAALIELGAGFHPEISGRENIYVNGAILGLGRRQIDQRLDSIIGFSGLADFIDEPVKNYSSGMYVRLGFAVAVHTDPDVLLVDEVLAVGDEAFGHKCLRRIEEMLAVGKTLLFVSHSLDLVEGLCDRVLWLEDGRPRLLGEPRRVVDAYRQAVAEEEGREHREEKEERQRREAAGGDEPADGAGDDGAGGDGGRQERRWGSRQVEISAVRLTMEDGERYHLVSGERVAFEVDVVAPQPQSDFVFGLRLTTPRGTEVWGTNTHLAGLEPERLDGRATVRAVCPALSLAPGEYLLDVAVHSRDGAPYDYWSHALGFTVTARDRGVGVYFPEHRWEAVGGVRWRDDAAATGRQDPATRSDE